MQYVETTPVLKLEEGETLRLRIYPWYNNKATGKTICLSDVTVHGVAVDGTSGIGTHVSISAEPVSAVHYYGLDGTKRSSMQKGINIVRTEYTDGTYKSEKIIK